MKAIYDEEIDSKQAYEDALDTLRESQAYIVIGTIDNGNNQVTHRSTIDGSRWGDLCMVKEYDRVINSLIEDYER